MFGADRGDADQVDDVSAGEADDDTEEDNVSKATTEDSDEDPLPPPSARACGSGDVPVPVGAPRAKRPARGRGRGRGSDFIRGLPEAKVVLEGGEIAYYASSKNSFQAKCNNPFHDPCVLTRKRSTGAHLGGQPVAFMYSWLQVGCLVDAKAMHWDSGLWDDLLADAAALADAREALGRCPEGRKLLSFEL